MWIDLDLVDPTSRPQTQTSSLRHFVASSLAISSSTVHIVSSLPYPHPIPHSSSEAALSGATPHRHIISWFCSPIYSSHLLVGVS
jgi:hypothetical protein